MTDKKVLTLTKLGNKVYRKGKYQKHVFSLKK